MSGVLGGRDEVLQAPVEDLLGYLIIKMEEDEAKALKEREMLFLNHLSRSLVKPESEEQQRANSEFSDIINPNSERNTPAEEMDLKWDFE